MSNENLNQENIHGENYGPAPWLFTPEEWEQDGDKSSAVCGANIVDANRKSIFTLDLDDYSSLDTITARRIVACVNACEGLDTELLEASVGTMFHTLRMIERLGAERDKYRKALEDCYQYHQFESAFITRNQVRNILIEALK